MTLIELIVVLVVGLVALSALLLAAAHHLLGVVLLGLLLVIGVHYLSRLLPTGASAGLDAYERRALRTRGGTVARLLPWAAWAACGLAMLVQSRTVTQIVVLCGVWLLAALLLVAAGVGRRRDIPGVVVVFDRELDTRDAPHPITGGTALHLFRREVEAVARALQAGSLEPLHGKVEAGAARHDPAAGLRVFQALLSNPLLLPDPARLVPELEAIRARLVIAAACQARFCLMSSATWSGLIESNLHLYRQ